MSLIIRNFKRRRRWQAGSLSAAESYPTSEVRDSGPECQAATVQERLGGATRGVVAAQAQEGLEELSHVEGQEWQQ